MLADKTGDEAGMTVTRIVTWVMKKDNVLEG